MEILISAERIQHRIDEMAQEIMRDYNHEPITIIGVLTGSIIFIADLMRRLDMKLRIGLIQASSYRGTATTAGDLHVNKDWLPDLRGRHLLVLDDILDTAKTLARIKRELEAMSPASVRFGVLLRKVGRQQAEFEPEYVGFEIPDKFVIGYGLDYDDEYRNLPFIGVLK
jgi:hypoxanthine phosphoribosyltransferase